jgi:hypothetical protein
VHIRNKTPALLLQPLPLIAPSKNCYYVGINFIFCHFYIVFCHPATVLLCCVSLYMRLAMPGFINFLLFFWPYDSTKTNRAKTTEQRQLFGDHWQNIAFFRFELQSGVNGPFFQYCGSRSGIRCLFTPRIHDPDPGSGMIFFPDPGSLPRPKFKILPLKMAKNRKN